RPADYRGWRVPDVLVSGNHAQIGRWQKMESIRRTWLRRPDLLENVELTEEDKNNLEKIRLGLI
ncbi:MAG TPA: tRNA (guanosine(37)-N1)-methyltransferase TrmD, partial [Smithellaceae bacterium]|nr:tRNA (guanosine(37)-N1)-methyltransferase TrmD [Smithellaceae bacterium]